MINEINSGIVNMIQQAPNSKNDGGRELRLQYLRRTRIEAMTEKMAIEDIAKAVEDKPICA